MNLWLCDAGPRISPLPLTCRPRFSFARVPNRLCHQGALESLEGWRRKLLHPVFCSRSITSKASFSLQHQQLLPKAVTESPFAVFYFPFCRTSCVTHSLARDTVHAVWHHLLKVWVSALGASSELRDNSWLPPPPHP